MEFDDLGCLCWCSSSLFNSELQSTLLRVYGQPFWKVDSEHQGMTAYFIGTLLGLDALDALEISDMPSPIPVRPTAEPPSWLGVGQQMAVSAVGTWLLGRGIIQAPTGSGKTHIVLGIVDRYGGNWIYVVGNRELAEQTREKMMKLSPGLAGSLVCCSYAGLKEIAETGRAVDGLIVDECHLAAAMLSRGQWVGKLRAKWRVGLSATPLDRTDDGNPVVVGLLGPVLHRMEMGEAVEEKRVCPGVVKRIRI